MDQKDAQILKMMGKIIARKRLAAGYTQEQVADQLGIGIDAFSRIERGLISPGIPKLYVMAELFECSIESFFVEGSKRVTDQAQHLSDVLEKNTPTDRTYIIEMVEKLSYRLAIGPVNAGIATKTKKR